MNRLLEIGKVTLAFTLLGLLLVVIWKLKWVLILAACIYVACVMACNSVYKKRKGKNMAFYNNLFSKGGN